MTLFTLTLLLSVATWAQTPATPEPTTAKVAVAAPAPQSFIESEEAKEQFNLTYHRPIYFAYGDPSTKIEFSFKFQLFKQLPLYLGYTQLMFWDLKRTSKPFRDLNYNPEIFYRLDIKSGLLDSIDLGPYEHKSNGKDGSSSRSLDRVFVQFNWLDIYRKNSIKASTRFSYLYSVDPFNPDLIEYEGPVDLRLTFTQFLPGFLDKGEFYVRAFAGGRYAQNWGNGGQEMGLSFRLGNLGFNHSFYVQYYSGYSELLMNYNHFDSNVRFGILL